MPRLHPEVPLHFTDHVFGIREGALRIIGIGHAPQMIGMAMGDQDRVHLLRLDLGSGQVLEQVARGRLKLAARAGIDEHEPIACVHRQDVDLQGGIISRLEVSRKNRVPVCLSSFPARALRKGTKSCRHSPP